VSRTGVGEVGRRGGELVVNCIRTRSLIARNAHPAGEDVVQSTEGVACINLPRSWRPKRDSRAIAVVPRLFMATDYVSDGPGTGAIGVARSLDLSAHESWLFTSHVSRPRGSETSWVCSRG